MQEPAAHDGPPVLVPARTLLSLTALARPQPAHYTVCVRERKHSCGIQIRRQRLPLTGDLSSYRCSWPARFGRELNLSTRLRAGYGEERFGRFDGRKSLGFRAVRTRRRCSTRGSMPSAKIMNRSAAFAKFAQQCAISSRSSRCWGAVIFCANCMHSIARLRIVLGPILLPHTRSVRYKTLWQNLLIVR
jgi:hypothetical protein